MKKVFAISAIVLFLSCNKSSESPSPYEALYRHAWINSNRSVNGVAQSISICDRDDTLTFGINGATTIDRGIEKCFLGQQKFSTGTYTVKTNQLSMTIDGTTTLYTLAKLNDAILNMYELRGTDTYRYVYTPKN